VTLNYLDLSFQPPRRQVAYIW